MQTHIVLFLKENLNIDFSILVEKMKECYKEIGNGIIIEKSSNNPNQPNFIFNNNKDLIIDGNNHHISINIFNEFESIKNDIIKMLWDAFDYLDLEFIRVGYIREIYNNSDNIEKIKSKLLKKEIAEASDEFQVAFHQTIKFERKNINCWKRYIKFCSSPLIINYDLNTKEENIKDINYKLLKSFIEFSDKYIEEDLIKFKINLDESNIN